jgi:hypothetical protein
VRKGRLAASSSCAALIITLAGCSTPLSSAPTDHRGSTRASAPVTTASPSTTTPPSATPTTVPVPVEQAPGWSGSLTTLPPGGGFTSLSCISDTFCVASGGGANQTDAAATTGSGVAVSWDGASWSDPSTYFPATSTGPTLAPIAPTLACTVGPICMIADGSGHVSTGDGTNWSAPAPLPSAPPLPANPSDPGADHPGSRRTAVSCPAPGFCAFVDNTGHATSLRSGTWATPQAFGTPSGSGTVALYHPGGIGLSCPSSSSCTAVVGTAVLDWNGSTWLEEQLPWSTAPDAGASGATAISCPTTTLCIIVNGRTVSFRTPGHEWSPVRYIDPQGGLDAITCPTTSFCLTADSHGSVVTWDGTHWSPLHRVLPSPTEYTGAGTSVSCSGDQFCMVMDGDGDYATYVGPATGSIATTP